MSEPPIIGEIGTFSLPADAEYWIVLSVGRIGLGFGPYSDPEAEEITCELDARGVSFTLVANCGRPLSFDLAQAVEARVTELRPAAEAQLRTVLLQALAGEEA